jgi:CxxC-x17-CxxC domain-containing protein
MLLFWAKKVILCGSFGNSFHLSMNKFNNKPRGSRPPERRSHFGGSSRPNARPRMGVRPGGPRPFGDRKEVVQKFDAICSQCGRKCQVPFRPNGIRPVFCNNCFGAPHDAQDKKGSPSGEGRSTAELTRQIAAMNNKIDAMLKILQGDGSEN